MQIFSGKKLRRTDNRKMTRQREQEDQAEKPGRR